MIESKREILELSVEGGVGGFVRVEIVLCRGKNVYYSIRVWYVLGCIGDGGLVGGFRDWVKVKVGNVCRILVLKDFRSYVVVVWKVIGNGAGGYGMEKYLWMSGYVGFWWDMRGF